MKTKDIKNLTLEELRSFLENNGYPKFHARQIFSWIYKKRIEDFGLMTDISKETKKVLKDNFHFSKIFLLKRETSKDKTEKFLFRLDDGLAIETVLIPEAKRNTLCVSTQAGCRFRCKFCMSGAGGLKRNLLVSEIINQYLAVSDLISPCKITNVVFMGIGEPLDNFSHTIGAVKILRDRTGISLGKRKVCISTCGLIPEIKKLTALDLGIKFSISLHSANNDIRTKLMPINKKYSLKELMGAVRQFAKSQKHPVTFEYILIREINVKKEDARALAKLLKGIKAKVNLIPYNDSQLKLGAPFAGEIDSFRDELKRSGVFFTLRKSRGQDINAACGQLAGGGSRLVAGE